MKFSKEKQRSMACHFLGLYNYDERREGQLQTMQSKCRGFYQLPEGKLLYPHSNDCHHLLDLFQWTTVPNSNTFQVYRQHQHFK